MEQIDVLNHNLAARKISDNEHEIIFKSQTEFNKSPAFVSPSPRLFDDLKMLEAMFKGEPVLDFQCNIDTQYEFSADF